MRHRGGRRRRRDGFMATHAREELSGTGRHPTAHHLEGFPFGIQRLKGNGGVGRHGEEGRTILPDGHRSQHSAHVPRTVHADGAIEAAVPTETVGVGVEPQGFHGAARDAAQPGPLVDVCHVERRLLRAGHDTIRDGGRHLLFPQGNGLKEVGARLPPQNHAIVEAVNEHNFPRGAGSLLARQQEVVIVKGIWMQALGPAAVHQLVAHDGLDLLPIAREPLDGALRLLAPEGGIEKDAFSHARHAMVPRHDAHEARIAAR